MKLKEILARLTTARAMMLGFAICAFYYFVFFDTGTAQTASIANLQNKIKQLQGEMQENQKKLDRAAVYKKSAAEVGSTINKLLASIPEKFAMPDLMKILSNESKVAGASLVSINPGETVPFPAAKEFEEMSVSINLSGTFLQHMIFLSNLTKVKQILIVRKLDFGVAKDAKGDEPASVRLDATIVAYRYRGSATSAKGGAAAPGVPGTEGVADTPAAPGNAQSGVR